MRIAAAESVGMSFLPALITQFGQRYPRLNIDLSIVPSSEVVERLVDERIDIGFCFIARPPRQVDIAFRRDVRIGVVLAATHPLAKVERSPCGNASSIPWPSPSRKFPSAR